MQHYVNDECAANEIFVGNHDSERGPFDCAHIPGVRLGAVALDINGNRLPPNHRPIFTTRGAGYDAYNRFMEAKLEAIRKGCGQ